MGIPVLMNPAPLIGAVVFLLVGLYLYLLSPRYWENVGDEDTPGALRAVWAVLGVRDVLLGVLVLGLGIYCLVVGNALGRLAGASLLALLLWIGFRFVRKRPRRASD